MEKFENDELKAFLSQSLESKDSYFMPSFFMPLGDFFSSLDGFMKAGELMIDSQGNWSCRCLVTETSRDILLSGSLMQIGLTVEKMS
jgi:hypothetical protein